MVNETAPGSSPSIEVRLLGPVELLLSGVPVPVAGPKPRSVLAMLALQPGQVISTDSLLDALYGPAWPNSGVNSLQVIVSGLRRLIEPDRGNPSVLVSQPPGYKLEIERSEVDVTRFEDSWEKGREAFQLGEFHVSADLLRSALGLWRGEPLAGLGEGSMFAADVGRLEEMRLACTEDLVDADLACGRHATLIGDLERLVGNNPLRERLQGQLMLALYRSGRQSDALLAYRRCRETLVEELGIDPSAALTRLERQMLQQDPDLDAAPSEAHGSESSARPAASRTPHPLVRLPGEAASFVGRRREVEELLADLSRHRLVTVTGLGGTGKTRLAVHAARLAVPAFPGGVTFVDLASVTTAEDAVGAAAAALQLDDLPEVVVDRLRGRLESESLLVLDNAEQIVDGDAFLRTLLDSGPAHLLVTSRVPIGVSGEVVRALPPLAVPDADVPTTEAIQYDGIALFTERAREAVRDIALDPVAVAELVRLLGGVPLAIELAAARLRVIELDALTSTLAQQLTVLSDPASGRPVRHRSLDALLRDGWDQLSALGHRLLTTISMFRSGASVSVAAEVSGLAPAVVLDLMGDLLDRGLLQTQRDTRAGPRFTVLELVRRFIQQHVDPDVLQEIRLGHARHVADVVGRSPERDVRDDREDLREAIRTVLAASTLAMSPAGITIEQRLALGHSALGLGWWKDVVSLLDPLRRNGEAANPLGVALLRRGERGDLERGRRLLSKAAESGDADAAAVLGGHYKDGDPKRSYAWYLKALEFDETDPYALGNVLEHEVRRADSFDVVPPRQAQLAAAMDRRRAQAARGEDLPWPWYDLARFQLLLGHENEGLDCLLNAVATSTHRQQLQTSLASLSRMRVSSAPVAWGHAVLILELAAVALFHHDPPSGATGGLTGPILVLAGASANDSHDEVMGWLHPLAAAMPVRGGSLISGGTDQGVSALAAKLAAGLPAWRSVGYLPSVVPDTVAADDRYDELRYTDSTQFGLAEPLAYWSDLLSSGITPADVYVLGIGGGSLTGLELHLAAELGAHVAMANVTSGPAWRGANDNAQRTNVRQVERDEADMRAWLSSSI